MRYINGVLVLDLDDITVLGNLAAARMSTNIETAINSKDLTLTNICFDTGNAIKRDVTTGDLVLYAGTGDVDEGAAMQMRGRTKSTALGGKVEFFLCYDSDYGNNPEFVLNTRNTVTSTTTSIFEIDKEGSIIKIAEIRNVNNLGIGTATFGTNADHVVAILNGTPPASSPADSVQLYAEDVAGESELKARDEHGDIATLTPHNFSLFTPDPSYYYPWSYYAKNPYLGKEINVDMEGAIRAIEALSGKQFIYTRDLPPEECEDLEANQRLNERIAEEQRIEKIVDVEMQKEIGISKKNAFEDVEIIQKIQIGTKTKYVLNESQGKIEEIEVPDFVEQGTGKFQKHVKSGIRFDEENGKFYRFKTREEALQTIPKN